MITTELQTKLKELRLFLGYKNQTAFAEKLNVSQGTIANMESGNREISKPIILKIKEVFDIDLLSWKEKDTNITTGNVIPIPYYSAKAAAGEGVEITEYPEQDVICFDKRFIQAVIGHSINNLSLITAEGDSMLPTIKDGDLLMIDDSIKDILPNKIFVIRQDTKLRVKRLKTNLNGETMIISDNPKYLPEAMDIETEIIGQVVWNGSKEIV